MSKLPKIPTPLSSHWQDFRHSVMPVLVFGVVLAFTVNLWNQHVAPPSIVGRAEAIESAVTTTVHGELVELHVSPLQRVNKGDPIATVVAMEDDMINASMNAARTDLLTLRARLEQDDARLQQDQYRALETFQRLRHDVAMRLVDRATENVNLQFAKAEYERAKKLFEDKTISQSEYDLARTRMEALQGKITELDKLIADMEASLKELSPRLESLSRTNGSHEVIVQAIAAAQKLIMEEAKPLVIYAPMDGIVSVIYKRKGEKVVRGDTLLVISIEKPSSIIGYVRQPLNIQPKVGDLVEVRARSFSRPTAGAKVLKVGKQLQLIDPGLLPLAVQNHGFEYGLPLIIELPPELNLLPGETVDISVANAR